MNCFDSAVIFLLPACRCNKQGSAKLTCDEETGSCTCKTGVRGRKCDTCPYGSYGFPNCQRTLSKNKCLNIGFSVTAKYDNLDGSFFL